MAEHVSCKNTLQIMAPACTNMRNIIISVPPTARSLAPIRAVRGDRKRLFVLSVRRTRIPGHL